MAKFERTRETDASHETKAVIAILANERERHLLTIQHEFSELAAQMRSFVETQQSATWALRKMSLDPMKAATGLSDLADAIALDRSERWRQPRPDMARSSENVALRRRSG